MGNCVDSPFKENSLPPSTCEKYMDVIKECLIPLQGIISLLKSKFTLIRHENLDNFSKII